MYKVILVPLDGSKQAESILPQVKSMASLYNAAVVLLKVEEPSILLGHDEVIDLAKYQEVDAHWSTNEKVAFEEGMGAALGGVRTMVTMKHVGLNVAADPFIPADFSRYGCVQR